MTLQECSTILAPMALAFRQEMDAPTFRVYHRVLERVPVALLELAVESVLSDGTRRFLPTAPELLGAAEKARRNYLAVNPHQACAECESQRGWRTVVEAGGQKRVERCPCVARHRESLQRMGLGSSLTELGDEGPQGEQVYPTLEQLPVEIQKRLRAVASQKVLR